MSQKIASDTFRSAFKTINTDILHWFPGHMAKGLKQMQQKLKSVDCVIEVHDARIPLSGRNNDFKYTISGIKPHILVLNKVDLIDKRFIKDINRHLKSDYEHIVYSNCRDHKCPGITTIFPLARKLISGSNRYNRNNMEDFNIMIIGIPNVGKSSLVNSLRAKHLKKGKASQVGASPGITRSVLNKIKMSENPLFYMLDTPGILTPKIGDIETGLKLALCGTITDHLVGETIIADYLLFWLNNQGHFDYVDYFKMEKPCDNILEVLAHISKQHNKILRLRNQLNEYIIKPNLDAAAQIMLKAFRDGNLGKHMLDEDLL